MKRALTLLLMVFLCLISRAQIVNRLRVDQVTFQRYARGRMQEFNPDNLALADSLYAEGVQKDNFRYKCLALSLEFPVCYATEDYERMDAAVQEIKELIGDRKDLREFYFPTLHEYCQFLVHIGRSGDALLEARSMERIASAEKKPLGKMYSYRIIGLIQSYRENHYLAVQNFEKAMKFSKEARAEQDLPNLYVLMAQECIYMEDFAKASDYCAMAEQYQEFNDAIRLKCLMTRAAICYAWGRKDEFQKYYRELKADLRYPHQTDADTRTEMDICYLRSLGLLNQALSLADSLGTSRARMEQKHGLYAELGAYNQAYLQLAGLMSEKDSTYIKVQNEDLAIMDAEMNNAQLREEAQRLQARNQITILLGFLFMFAIAFLSILVQQWRLRENLDQMKKRNTEMLRARRAYQRALDAKEAENNMKIKILQNRKSSTIKL